MKKKEEKWYDKIEGITVRLKDTCSHVPQKKLMEIMPEDLKEAFDNFIYGQTGLHCDDGDFGVYSWDLARFVGKYKRQEDFKDNIFEWD